MPAQPPPSEAGGRPSPSPASANRLDRGDVVNLLGRLRDRLRAEGRKITVVQNRLIMQRIEAAGVLAEPNAVRTEQQIGRIASIVAETLGMGEERIETVLRACRR